MRPRLLLPLVAALLLLPACSSSDDGPVGAAASPAATAAAGPTAGAPAATPAPTGAAADVAETPRITIADFAYAVPPSVTAGAEVELVNEDSEAHTVTLADGGPSVVVQGGTTATLTAPAQAGTYRIGCEFHGNMTAELVVT